MIKLAKYCLLTRLRQMFGMALKFFELNIQPLSSSKAQTKICNQNQDQQKPKQQAFKNNKKARTQTNFQRQQQSPTKNKGRKPIFQKAYQNKENIPHLKITDLSKTQYDRTNSQQKSTIQELKQSQLKVIQDFKRSIEKSLQNRTVSKNQPEKSSKISYKEDDQFQGQILSKIDELSQEYLEYSTAKQGFYNSKYFHVSNNQRSHIASSQLIKSVVKSIIFEGQKYKDGSYRNSQSRSPQVLDYCLNNRSTNEQSEVQVFEESPQQVTQFIKDLFQSLGLIDENQRNSEHSFKEITESAKKNFQMLKGCDYVQKLHQMLNSIQSHSQKFEANNQNVVLQKKDFYAPKEQVKKECDLKKIADMKVQKQRQELMTRKNSLRKNNPFREPLEQKKVKVISPETISQLSSKRVFIENEINEAMEFLTQLRRVKKFNFDSFQINQVHLNFSLNFQFLAYKYVRKGIFQCTSLSSILSSLCNCALESRTQQIEDAQCKMIRLPWNLVNVSKGIRTKNFIRYEDRFLEKNSKNNPEILHEERCFSLLFKDRTYDFQCESGQVRDQLYRTIKIMIKSADKA